MSFCTKCGANVPDGSSFCTTCGAPMNTAQAPAMQPASAAPAPEMQAAPAPEMQAAQPQPMPYTAPVYAQPAAANTSKGIASFFTTSYSTKDMVGKYGMLGSIVLMLISCFIPFYNFMIKYDDWYTYEVSIKMNLLIGKLNDNGEKTTFPFMGWFILVLGIVAILLLLLDKKVPTIILSAITAFYGFISFIVLEAVKAYYDNSFLSGYGDSSASMKDVIAELKEMYEDYDVKVTYSKGPAGLFLMIGLVVLIVSIILYATSHKKKTV